MRSRLAFVLVAIAALAAGIAFQYFRLTPEPPAGAEAQLWTQQLKDVRGNPAGLETWRGKVLVVNFWATWCAPCREEIPLFVRLQNEYGARGLQFVGVAIDEPQKVAYFMREFGMNYPVLVGALDAAEWSRRLGNQTGALPYTLVIGTDGKIRMAHLGALKEADLLPYIRTLLP